MKAAKAMPARAARASAARTRSGAARHGKAPQDENGEQRPGKPLGRAGGIPGVSWNIGTTT